MNEQEARAYAIARARELRKFDLQTDRRWGAEMREAIAQEEEDD